MAYDSVIPQIYLKGNQTPLGVKQHMEAISEHFEGYEVEAWKTVEAWVLLHQEGVLGRR